MIRLLHTSDWHLGRTLCGNKRDDEFALFLRWLVECVEHRHVEVLLIAGDIFDGPAPNVAAQQVYYEFLRQIMRTSCRHVVIIAGNHDSPAFLEAPRGVLKEIGVHVIGAACDGPEAEVVCLRNCAGEVEMVIAAVPFLRDRDVRKSSYGECDADRDRALVEGVQSHYKSVTLDCLKHLPPRVPLVAMGHLFAAGSSVSSGDGVRELYIGSLGQIPCSVFPRDYDYVALGHLHRMQKAAAEPEVWYSGSPLAMGFGEAEGEKFVRVLDFQPAADWDGARVTESKRFDLVCESVAVPAFRRLVSVAGDVDGILEALDRELILVQQQALGTWVEVIYRGLKLVPDLVEQLNERVAGSAVAILRVRAERDGAASLVPGAQLESLDREAERDALADDGAVMLIFERCLESNQVPDDQCEILRALHNEVCQELGLWLSPSDLTPPSYPDERGE